MLQLFAAKKDTFNLDLMNVSDSESPPLESLEDLVKKIPPTSALQIPDLPTPTSQASTPQIAARMTWGLAQTLQLYIPSPWGFTQTLKTYLHPLKTVAINTLPRDVQQGKIIAESEKIIPPRGGLKRKIVIDSAKTLLK